MNLKTLPRCACPSLPELYHHQRPRRRRQTRPVLQPDLDSMCFGTWASHIYNICFLRYVVDMSCPCVSSSTWKPSACGEHISSMKTQAPGQHMDNTWSATWLQHNSMIICARNHRPVHLTGHMPRTYASHIFDMWPGHFCTTCGAHIFGSQFLVDPTGSENPDIYPSTYQALEHFWSIFWNMTRPGRKTRTLTKAHDKHLNIFEIYFWNVSSPGVETRTHAKAHDKHLNFYLSFLLAILWYMLAMCLFICLGSSTWSNKTS